MRVRVVLGTAAKTQELVVKIQNFWKKLSISECCTAIAQYRRKGERVFWPAIAEKLKELMMSASGRVVRRAWESAAATDECMDLHAAEFRRRFAEYCPFTRDLTRDRIQGARTLDSVRSNQPLYFYVSHLNPTGDDFFLANGKRLLLPSKDLPRLWISYPISNLPRHTRPFMHTLPDLAQALIFHKNHST